MASWAVGPLRPQHALRPLPAAHDALEVDGGAPLGDEPERGEGGREGGGLGGDDGVAQGGGGHHAAHGRAVRRHNDGFLRLITFFLSKDKGFS